MNSVAEATETVPVSDVAYCRLKLLACAIEAAFAAHDFAEANMLLEERRILLDELGPNARLNQAQAKDISALEARIGWQVHVSQANIRTGFRRLQQARNLVKAYVGTGTARLNHVS